MTRRLCLLFFLLSSTLAVAEKYALLVGINDYPNDISPLRYCVADVVAFRDTLVNVSSFKKGNIFLMTDGMEGQMEPTNINIVKRLSILAQQIKSSDTLVFYFSGHCIVNDSDSFLLAANSDTTTQDTLEMSGVSLDRVSKILSSVKAHQLLTVIDACRYSPEASRSGEDSVLTDEFSKGFKIRRNSSDSQPRVSATLYACSIGERAYEWSEKGHGVFSYYLLKGMNGGVADSQGQVTVTDLAEYTQSKVMDWAKTYRNKRQMPWLSLQGGTKLILVENRLATVKAERRRLESELAKTKQQLDQAQKADGALSRIEDIQRKTELQEKVRQAKATKELDRQREETARQEREEVTRQQREKSIKQAANREQIRRERAEIERKKQQLEAERQKLQAQQLESIDISQLLQKAKELQDKINGVGLEVRAEVNHQIGAIPKPQKSQVNPQDEFETKSMYQKRLNQYRQDDEEREQRYQQEVDDIMSTIDNEIKLRSQGYQDALALLNRNIVLDETQVVLNLGRYDPENQIFADASLSTKGSRQLQVFDWFLKVPLSYAKQFKKSVENGTVKIRVEVELEAENQTANIKSVLVEDLVQDLQCAHPLPQLTVKSTPGSARVSVDGRYIGLTPYSGRFRLGQHHIEVSKTYRVDNGYYQPSKKQTITLEHGVDQSLDIKLPQPVPLGVVSDPAGLDVRINDKDFGQTPLTLSLPPGSYRVGLSRIKGLETQPQSKTVMLVVGEEDLVEFKVNYDRTKFKIVNQKLIEPYKGMVLIPSLSSMPAFYMDKYEVTNAQYHEFVQATGHRDPIYWDNSKYNQPNQPVVGVSWNDAVAYAKWLGKRIPTEKEWEWAARGGLLGKKYPWGDQQPNSSRTNYYGANIGKPTAVGSYPANGYGLYDMAGNVLEWCQDWYDRDQHYKVLRGGSWADIPPILRVADRNNRNPLNRGIYHGFRCVSGLPFASQ